MKKKCAQKARGTVVVPRKEEQSKNTLSRFISLRRECTQLEEAKEARQAEYWGWGDSPAAQRPFFKIEEKTGIPGFFLIEAVYALHEYLYNDQLEQFVEAICDSANGVAQRHGLISKKERWERRERQRQRQRRLRAAR